MCLCLKQSSLFSLYALPSGGKSKGVVVHLPNRVTLHNNSQFGII